MSHDISLFYFRSFTPWFIHAWLPDVVLATGTLCIYIDYYMAFFIAYPLSALGHDINQRADSNFLVRNKYIVIEQEIYWFDLHIQ